MYPHQLERLTGGLDAAGAEALVASSAANVAYLTGFRALGRALAPGLQFGIFTRRGTALVVQADDVAAALDESEADQITCFGVATGAGEGAGPSGRRVQAIASRAAETGADALKAALEALDVRGGFIALDEAHLSAEDGQRIAERLAPLRIMPGSRHLATARRVKGPFEIECLAGALRIAEEALNEVIQMLKRGVTEREATTVYLAEVVKRGGFPLPSAVAVGERTALGRTWATDRALRVGEVIRLDVGCIHRGYAARVGRTAVLGDATQEQEAAHGAIQQALEAAVDAAAAGAAGRAVHEASLRAMREQGLPEFRSAGVGHGIGLEPRELPDLASDDVTTLEPGEVLNLEVSCAAVGRQGFLARDTVLITAAGARALNRSARGLVVLD